MESVIKVLNGDQGTRETIHQLLSDTCPQLVRGLLEAGKPELEKQGQSAVLTPRGLFLCFPITVSFRERARPRRR